MEHRTVDLDGPVHYVDFGGTGRPMLLVHGLGGSHVNWMAVGPRLASRHHVVAIDLAGHGRTRCDGTRTARVSANRRLLGTFIDAVAGEPVVLVGNSMGGYLSLAEAAAEPEKVTGLVLVDPAVPTARAAGWDPVVFALFAGYALPVVGGVMMRSRARRRPEDLVRDMLELCCADAAAIPREVFDAHVAMARERLESGVFLGRDFLAAQRSLMARLIRRRHFFAMVAGIHAPVLIVQGERDRLVRVAAARALAAARPDWRLEVLEGIGHMPQLEAPERFLAIVETWLEARACSSPPRTPLDG